MMIMLLMLIFIPFFSTYFWRDVTKSYQTDLNFLALFLAKDQTTAEMYIEGQYKDRYEDFKWELIEINLAGVYSKEFESDSNLREEELRQSDELIDYQNTKVNGLIRISVRKWVQIQALLNFFRVLIILAIFLIGVHFFKKDARAKILHPLEQMLSKVREMARNPSKALKFGINDKENYNSDIAVIDETIQKIAYLLVLGFGEAGNSLLSKVLYTNDFEFDFVSEAHTIYGIYGFCDIRNFTDATEILTEDVLLFVNAIAKVVHSEVSSNEGGANKNIGDAFLVVWRLKGSDVSDIK